MEKRTSNPLWYNGFAENTLSPGKEEILLRKIIPVQCPKCNNSKKLHRYGKTLDGYQKYQCQKCFHQFAPDKPFKPVGGRTLPPDKRKYPSCPKCGVASYLHHDYEHYSNYCCRKCYHSFYVCKPTTIAPASMSKLFGKTDFKRMRYPVHTILQAIIMFYLGTTSFRKIALIMRLTYNVKVSHQTISDWCKKFAPIWQNISLELIPALDFNSDEWHADETVVKIGGIKHYIWFVIDSETRFVLGFHLSPRRNSPQAFTTFQNVKHLGNPNSVVTDRYYAYNTSIKAVMNVPHIKVESFKAEMNNNLIECFNKQFKAWYKTKNGFCDFNSANNMIATFVFFFNFVRPHMALLGLTPAQVAGLELDAKQRRRYLNLVA